MIIIGASLILLRIIYKIIQRALSRRYQRDQEYELVELFQESTRVELECGGVTVQRPPRALTRRSSEVSALPRYGVDQGELCDEYVEVEKMGKYSYVVNGHWPGGGKV